MVDTSVGSKNVWIFVSFAFQELSFDKELESFRKLEVHFQIQPILVNSGGLRMNFEYLCMREKIKPHSVNTFCNVVRLYSSFAKART